MVAVSPDFFHRGVRCSFYIRAVLGLKEIESTECIDEGAGPGMHYAFATAVLLGHSVLVQKGTDSSEMATRQ